MKCLYMFVFTVWHVIFSDYTPITSFMWRNLAAPAYYRYEVTVLPIELPRTYKETGHIKKQSHSLRV